MEKTFLAILGLLLLSVHHGNSEPRFDKEPEDFTGFSSKLRILTSKFSGGINPEYQWHHNGSTLFPPLVFGMTSETLRFFQTSLATQGTYQLYVSSKIGRIFGREIKVEFLVVGKFPDKTKRTRNVVIGKPFEIECPPHEFTQHAVYKWGGTGTVTGTWFFNDKPNALVLGDGRLFFSHVTREDVKLISRKGGIGCLLEANHDSDIRIEQTGLFELNATGEETKSFGPYMQKISDEEVVEGSTILLKCIAAGYPTPTYEWKWTDRLGVTSSVLTMSSTALTEHNKQLEISNLMKDRHAGTYTCYATVDDNGRKNTTQESSKVTIREKPAWVTDTKIKSATPDIYSQHSWMCMARGDPEPEYHWYANATIMNNVSGRHIIEGGILTFHRVTPEDDGMYQCTAKNKFGFAYQTVSLKVKVKSPEITQALSEENFVAGNSGVISCVSDALPPAEHHWLFNGAELQPNKTTKYDLTARQDLIVHNLTQADTGTYTCVATNIYGQVSKDKDIKVAEIMFKRRPENKTNVIEGTGFSLFCEAESDPPLNIRYKWLFDGKGLQSSDIVHNWDVSAYTLTVSDAQGHQSGIYECVAYSPTSQKSSKATIIVRALPDPPEKLTLHGTCTDLTANLTWVIRYRNAYEPLTRILIQWSTSRDTSTWYNFSDHVAGSANGHVVKGLNPYSDILFRVIAENEYGIGKPSNVTTGQECKTPTANAASLPTETTATYTQPKSSQITSEASPPVTMKTTTKPIYLTSKPTITSTQPETSQITPKSTSPVTVTTITTAKTTSSSSGSSNEEDQESNASNTALIAALAISLVVIVILGIIVGFEWKKIQRIQDKNLKMREMQNIDEPKRANTEGDISVYDEVVRDTAIDNDGIYEESLPSSAHNNDNRRLSDHKYEEPSNYEPLRRNSSQDQNDANYQSLTTSQ